MEKEKREAGMYFLFLAEILSARRAICVIMTATCGHRCWLIVNSEVNLVERKVPFLNFRNVSNKTTSLI